MEKLRLLTAALFSLGLTSPTSAQTADDFRQRTADLITLSGVFGDLHHIRRYCEPRMEADTWRNRMRRIVELEEPQTSTREAMVAAFNKSYKQSELRFQRCDRQAKDFAAARALEGDAVVARLMAPLYEAMSEGEGTPQVWRGTVGPTNQLQIAPADVPDPD